MPSSKGFNQKQYKTIRKMIQSDKSYKEKQADASLADLTSTGDLTEFTSIGEGNDFNTRSSDKTNLIKIELQVEMLDNVGSGGNTTVRVIVARGRNGPLSTGDFPSTAGAINTDKLQVYYDKISLISDKATASKRFTFKKSFAKGKIPHMVLRYDDAESASACQHNPVYLWMISDKASGPEVSGNVTANFYDTA